VREGKFDPGKHKLTEALFATPQLETVLSRGVLRRGVLLRPIGGPMRNRNTCPVAPSRARSWTFSFPRRPTEPAGRAQDRDDPEDGRAAAAAVAGARRQLLVFLAAAEGKVEAFELSVEQWYDEQVAKIGSCYKRWSRVVPGIVGLVVAAALHLET
jgi:hypothetical protein